MAHSSSRAVSPLTVSKVGTEPFGALSLRRWLLGCVAMVMGILCSGCVTTLWPFKAHKPPPVAPCQVVVHWHNEVGFAPDAQQQGKPVPGFAGRLYLFGVDRPAPIPATGQVKVTLFDPNTRDAQGNPKPIQDWTLPPAMLETVKSQDIFGEGYTLFLPWDTYHPAVVEVLLRTEYTPKNGVPLFFDSGVIKLGGLKVLKAPVVTKTRQLGIPPSAQPGGTANPTQLPMMPKQVQPPTGRKRQPAERIPIPGNARLRQNQPAASTVLRQPVAPPSGPVQARKVAIYP